MEAWRSVSGLLATSLILAPPRAPSIMGFDFTAQPGMFMVCLTIHLALHTDSVVLCQIGCSVSIVFIVAYWSD